MGSPLSPGTKLGRYEIRSQPGAGGMGEVYLAVDLELDRTIALKILPQEFASDHQRATICSRSEISLSTESSSHSHDFRNWPDAQNPFYCHRIHRW
ncbi:hypothetical protein BH18ACI4_BH18ACI4_14800 [soil metagenome]